MKTSQAQWAEIRQRFLEESARRGIRLTLRDRVWAIAPGGEWIALPGTSDSPVADRWWLGCDPEKLQARHPIGVILLCKARGGSLYAIGLPATAFRDVEPRLSRNERQVFFNVVHRGSRFLLQLRGGEEVDVTERVDDLSWIANGRESIVSEEVPLTYSSATVEAPARVTELESATQNLPPIRFFAVVKGGNLHPLDDVALEPGSFYVVEARRAQAVPGSRALRRILARGGPADLPVDLAQQHDHYAHGAARR